MTDTDANVPREDDEIEGRLLVVDDDRPIREGLRRVLTAEGYDVRIAEDAEEALRLARESPPDLVVSDLNLPGRSGLELIAALQDYGIETTVVVLTGHASIESAIAATRRGVYDYLTKPVDRANLLDVVHRGLERAALRREVLLLRREMMQSGRLTRLVGRSPAMLELYREIEQVAPTSASVLITGESGTGKEL
ncbi:MAG: sigma-54-dependent Fis family transcriptional regulator, partial [Gemmatimonadetes bacterium]|nr:sigma-54-dependent Fis family transcriptional regulator [Gemmatimonadota bacterium]